MIDQLKEAYRNRQLILFVGAGVSMNLGLPSWRDLIDHIADELGFDHDIFRTFGTDLALAEFYRIQKGKIGPLRSWMDTQWHQKLGNVTSSPTHKLIVGANLDLVYTTNYDRCLEYSFEQAGKAFTKIAGVGDLINIPNDRTQIVKFHGDFDDDASIVLDETSYFKRFSFESPLDIKLRSDLLGRSVLFIGYSLSDINIRYMFYRLANIWKASESGISQPKSYVFSPKPNAIQEAVLSQWNISMISSGESDQGKALKLFLEDLFN